MDGPRVYLLSLFFWSFEIHRSRGSEMVSMFYLVLVLTCGVDV